MYNIVLYDIGLVVFIFTDKRAQVQSTNQRKCFIIYLITYCVTRAFYIIFCSTA